MNGKKWKKTVSVIILALGAVLVLACWMSGRKRREEHAD